MSNVPVTGVVVLLKLKNEKATQNELWIRCFPKEMLDLGEELKKRPLKPGGPGPGCEIYFKEIGLCLTAST